MADISKSTLIAALLCALHVNGLATPIDHKFSIAPLLGTLSLASLHPPSGQEKDSADTTSTSGESTRPKLNHKTQSTAPKSPDASNLSPSLQAVIKLIKAGKFSSAIEALTHLRNDDSQDQTTVWLLLELATHWENTASTSRTSIANKPTLNPRVKKTSSPTDSELASLYVDSVVYGFASGAIWMGAIFEVNSAAGVLLPSLGLAGLSSYGVYALNDQNKFKRGMPRTISLGLRLGFVQSTLLASYAGSEFSEVDGKTALVGAFAGTTLGGIAGGYVAHKHTISPARASLIESSAIWGGVLTAMGHDALNNGNSENEILLSSAVGVFGGALVGALIIDDQALSESRVRYLDLGGIGGGLVAATLYYSFEPENHPAFVGQGIVAGGILSGWFTALHLTRGTPTSANHRSQETAWRLTPRTDGTFGVNATTAF